jgi:hypothetical protein
VSVRRELFKNYLAGIFSKKKKWREFSKNYLAGRFKHTFGGNNFKYTFGGNILAGRTFWRENFEGNIFFFIRATEGVSLQITLGS